MKTLDQIFILIMKSHPYKLKKITFVINIKICISILCLSHLKFKLD